MRDARTLLLGLLITAPFACSHDDRGAASPSRGTAGTDVGAPAPSTTNEPGSPEAPNASPNHGVDGADQRPGAFDDSRTTIRPDGVAQPVPHPGSGGSAPGSGGTLGSGGTGTGGFGPGAGTGGIATGGSIVH